MYGMKRIFVSITLMISLIVVVALLCACESNHSNSTDPIVGKWRAYGAKNDDGIYSYNSAYDKNTAKQLENRFMEFDDDGKVTMYDGDVVLVEGKYTQEKSKSQYAMVFDIGKNETATLNAQFDEKYLIITEVVPDEYKDEVDEGDSNAFVKVDK